MKDWQCNGEIKAQWPPEAESPNGDCSPSRIRHEPNGGIQLSALFSRSFLCGLYEDHRPTTQFLASIPIFL